jgi:hypothetical protein
MVVSDNLADLCSKEIAPNPTIANPGSNPKICRVINNNPGFWIEIWLTQGLVGSFRLAMAKS